MRQCYFFLRVNCTEEPGRPQSMGSAKSRTRLRDFTFTFHFHALEKEMATHSSVLAWRIPGTGEPAVYGVAQSRARLKQLSSSSSSMDLNRESLVRIGVTENVP